MSPEKWLEQHTFYCPVLQARLTPDQCATNRARSKRQQGWGWVGGDGPKAPPQCAKCDFERYQQGEEETSDDMAKCNICKQRRPQGDYRISEVTGRPVKTCMWCESKRGLGPWRHTPGMSVADYKSKASAAPQPQPGQQPEQEHEEQDPGQGLKLVRPVQPSESKVISQEAKDQAGSELVEDDLMGMDGCEIFSPGQKRVESGKYVRFWASLTMLISPDLTRRIPEQNLYVLVGYNRKQNILVFKLGSKKTESSMTARRERGRSGIKMSAIGFSKAFNLDVAGRTFRADYDPDTSILTVFLANEISEAK